MVRRISSSQRKLVKSEKSSGKSTIKSIANGIVNATKDAIAKGVNEAKNIIEKTPDYGYRTIDNLALNNRCKYNFMDGLINGLSIDKFCNFNNKNEVYMRRLMMVNITEHDITMKALGTDAAFKGDGSHITTNTTAPSYVSNLNYTDNFARNVNGMEQNGYLSTRRAESRGSDNDGNYVNHGQLYGQTTNLFPDDNDSLTDDIAKWELEGEKNSILTKTKELFNQAKINTLISRFHGDGGVMGGSENVKGIGDANTEKFGKSHGRNLLLRDVEKKGGNGYSINGYNNPYCRVWTHHYQYDRLFKRIRPFYQMDDYGNFKSVTKLKDFHHWHNFSHDDTGNITFNKKITWDKKGTEKWGWKSGDNDDAWNKSVIQDNGYPNITPKYQGGGEYNIHTKQCMFSIENLAWKGYDPYSFEKALSWEQRGPNGGRIMWFPPYGIDFNETTNVNWGTQSFIGRGEDVYTYVNTTRTGTLSFMLVVDHPSIIDYVGWHADDIKDKVKDSDLLRFFAGCDSGNPEDEGSLLHYVKPTPLTDEYIQNVVEEELSVTAEPEKREPQQEKKTEELVMTFYVFYPNNYSGYYDHIGSNVEAIAYLLAGSGAQMQSNGDNKNAPTKDIPLTIEMLSDDETWDNGYGYEVKNSETKGISNYKDMSDNKNYIHGTKPIWQYQKNRNSYQANNKKWYYRIDGKYQQAPTSEYYINTYDQTLLNDSNYSDTTSFAYNSDASAVRKLFEVPDDEENKSVLYSFAEVAAALESNKNETISDNITKNCLGSKTDRIDKLKEIFYGDEKTTEGRTEGKYKVVRVETIGYSNNHDKNKTTSTGTTNKKSVSTTRNDKLAINRGRTVINWLEKRYGNVFTDDINQKSTVQASKAVNSDDKLNVNGSSAKKWRSAKVMITFERDVTTTLAESNSGENVKYKGYTEIKDENQNTAYKDENGDIWYLSEDKTKFVRKVNKLGKVIARSQNSISNLAAVNNDGWREISASEYEKIKASYPNAVECRENRSGVAKYYTNIAKYNWKFGEIYLPNMSANDSTQEYNNLRYDQEYYFFKTLEHKAPAVYSSLMDKIQYFDPAFHSMTPEGFNARLTFLQQCTRQGNTIGASDRQAKSANNLAFGRAPYCVLRLGDFYNQLIVIDNISIDYDPLQWDLNTESIGMQPLLAHVNISFKFIGGGDLAGPVKRLQNAMTFNYYANTRLYDNRADRPSYKENYITGISELETDKSYAYTTDMKKEIK